MDRARWVLGLGGLSVACLVALPTAAFAAPSPAPTPAKKCHVIPDPQASRRPTPKAGTVAVVIPRTNCSAPVVRPSPQPVQNAEGGANTSTGGIGAGPGGGKVPFTGADVARWAALGAALVSLGTLVVAAGRRRRGA